MRRRPRHTHRGDETCPDFDFNSPAPRRFRSHAASGRRRRGRDDDDEGVPRQFGQPDKQPSGVEEGRQGEEGRGDWAVF